MRILLTNDDGIHSQGLMVLKEALESLGEVYVVAPEGERTAVSHALTLRCPVRLWEVGEGIWATDGTPADCVHLALHVVLGGKPDLVVSGPNNGPNMGEEVFYSGTVAAALEAAFMGIPAVAISMATRRDHRYETAARVALKVIERLRRCPLPPRIALNVNVPNLPMESLKGFKVTRLAHRVFPNRIQEGRDPRGGKYYWIGGPEPEFLQEVGTDAFAVSQGYVSLTPLKADLTAYGELEKMVGWEGPIED